jgi:hypothetical protein
MSGIPQFNFPLFYRVTAALRKQGYDVVSPAELDDMEDKGVAMKSKDGKPASANRSWGDFLSRDVKLLADGGITGIIFLPDWEKSSGAKLEATVGLLKKFEFMRWDDELNTPVQYARRSVAASLYQEFTK